MQNYKYLSEIKLAFYDAVINKIERWINAKFGASVANNSTTPWQLGWAGSRAKITKDKTDFVVPQTISDVDAKIKEYRSEIQGLNRTNKSHDESIAIDKRQIQGALKTLDQIFHLVNEKATINTQSGAVNTIVNFLRSVFGRGRATEVTQDYDKLRYVTSSYGSLSI